MGSKAVVFGSPPWGGEFCFFSLMLLRFLGRLLSFVLEEVFGGKGSTLTVLQVRNIRLTMSLA